MRANRKLRGVLALALAGGLTATVVSSAAAADPIAVSGDDGDPTAGLLDADAYQALVDAS